MMYVIIDSRVVQIKPFSWLAMTIEVPSLLKSSSSPFHAAKPRLLGVGHRRCIVAAHSILEEK
jgi:hypothetical protein